ncbi:hypothetical protein EDC04DRAFT_2608813 [Pisolithus marmoratus]|nr:hypothetical protein EDC04DRAFT_2608813 [Pisolithus marmoratus]
MRINDNLYTYGDEMISKVIGNMNKGVPPPIPTHKQSVGQTVQWERDMMGPIILYDTVEEIHKLYATAYNEPEDKAPCVHKVQGLVTYINLWKRCRLEMNEVMDLTVKEWRPPVWASQKACQKREALRDRERASQMQAREGGPSRSKTVSNQLTLQGWIADAPPIPSAPAAEEPRPMMPLTHCIMAQPSGGSAPINDWVKFIHQYQNQSDNFDKSSKLSRMFPRALGFSSHPDNDEAECQSLKETMTGMSGSYRALLEWAEVAPADGTPVPWGGEFTHLATVANVTTYLAANGVMYHNANDALKWAWRVGNEYVAQVISNGGDKDPNTKAIVNQMRATLNEPLPVGEHHSLEWIDLLACVLGVTPKSIAPYEAHPIKERDLYVLEEFTKLAALYDLSHHARGEGSNAGGVVLIPANTLREGEMEDDSRPM